MTKIRIDLLSLLLLAALCVLGAVRWHAALGRPLFLDEVWTAKSYASMDSGGTAETMPLLPRFDVRRTVKGLMRCFNSDNDWTTNNHMVNSFLISISTFLFGFKEAACRMPALLAALALMVLVFERVRRQTGSRVAAVLCALVVLLHPYFVHYGATARGYTWMTLLVWVQLWLLEVYGRCKPSLGWVTGLGLLGVVIFLNLSTMLLTWIAPFYLAGLFLLIPDARSAEGRGKLRAWVAQGGIAFAGIGLFIVGVFQEFTSSRKFGGEFNSGWTALGHLGTVFSYYFPFPWAVLGIIGVAGWVRMLRKDSWRWGGVLAFTVVLFSAAFVFATRTTSAPRIFGFYLPLLLLGVMQCWNWGPGSGGRMVRWIMVAGLGFTLASEAVMGHQLPESEMSYGELAQEVKAQIRKNGESEDSVFIPLPPVYSQEVQYYLPTGEGWLEMSRGKQETVTVYFTGIRGGKGGRFAAQYAKQAFRYWEMPVAAGDGTGTAGSGMVKRLRARVWRDFAEVAPGTIPWLVVWNSRNPYFDLARYVGDRLRQGADSWTLPVHTLEYLPAKSLHLFIRDEADVARARAVIAELEAQSPGEVYILGPEKNAPANISFLAPRLLSRENHDSP